MADPFDLPDERYAEAARALLDEIHAFETQRNDAQFAQGTAAQGRIRAVVSYQGDIRELVIDPALLPVRGEATAQADLARLCLQAFGTAFFSANASMRQLTAVFVRGLSLEDHPPPQPAPILSPRQLAQARATALWRAEREAAAAYERGESASGRIQVEANAFGRLRNLTFADDLFESVERERLGLLIKRACQAGLDTARSKFLCRVAELAGT